MTIEEAVITRIKALLSEGMILQKMQSSSERGTKYIGWCAAVLNIVQQVIPDPKSGYREVIEQIIAAKTVIDRTPVVLRAISEVLSNLLKDAEAGLISSFADKARAEVFDDFLDHAKSHLSEGHYHRAGVIAGVVFEDSLRRVCRKNDIEESGVKLDSLISSLDKAGVISPTKAKRARVAAHVRTKATHAQWGQFDKEDVKATIDFTDELILNHIDG